VISFSKIGHRITAGVGVIFAVGLVGMVFFYANEQEESILAQNERSVKKVTESVIHGLQTVMLAGYADIAQAFASSLKVIPEVHDFRIIRRTGKEAFRDNKTINEVNERRGEEDFFPRDEEFDITVLPGDFPGLVEAINTQAVVNYYETTKTGEKLLTFLAPIPNTKKCQKCHGKDHEIRGVLKLTTSLYPIQTEISESWKRSMFVLAGSLLIIIITTSMLIRQTVVHPISRVTRAMEEASTGDLSQRVPVLGRDELSTMANSFNTMIGELLSTHTGLHNEQNKLTTIILSAQEGIIVTDGDGNIVLVNPAAVDLLGKPESRIVAEGLLDIFDDRDMMENWLALSAHVSDANLHEYRGRILEVSVSTICDDDGAVIGKSALIRDITAQKELEAELRMLSNTDGLTGLYNRRFLDEAVEKELRRSIRYGTVLSILMFDVDHFKKFNDTYGHDHGDRVLQCIALIMREVSRNVDYPCRYGGEEFIVILPNTAKEGAMIFAERLRVRVAETPVDGVSVNISIGVASLPGAEVKGGEDFIKVADGALYKAKDAGRNRVVFAGD